MFMSWRSLAAGASKGALATALLSACAAGDGGGSDSAAESPAAESPAGEPSATVGPSPSATSELVPLEDGEAWISYQWVDPRGGDGIFLVRPDGTGDHQLVPDMPGSESHPEWSPDGERIAFIAADNTELWVINASGDGEERLYACDAPCNTVNYPSWAQDGEAIYFGQDANPRQGPPATFQVGKVDLESGDVSFLLTHEDDTTLEQPRISPDGTRVAFTRSPDVWDESTGSAIIVADLETGEETQLSEFELFGAHADWTDDGRIVFNSYDLGFFQATTEPSNLYLVNADGTGLQQLTNFGSGETRTTQPRVAPDGSGITFTQVDRGASGSRTLAFIGLDGTGLRSLTADPKAGTHPQLRPLPAD